MSVRGKHFYGENPQQTASLWVREKKDLEMLEAFVVTQHSYMNIEIWNAYDQCISVNQYTYQQEDRREMYLNSCTCMEYGVETKLEKKSNVCGLGYLNVNHLKLFSQNCEN